ncbi:MAG: hypothetical protein EOO10_18630 [Chitinophagaceae bacterium]|nr:MAG: hypothetical protein EOO10_18630 [Chitinophagaceae bacterium]
MTGIDETKALKWLKHHRRLDKTMIDKVWLLRASKSFQKETCYTNEMMKPVNIFMWQAITESQY